MLDSKIREKRDAYGKAIFDARETGKQIAEKQEKGEDVRELSAKFDKQYADAEKLRGDLDRLERELKLESFGRELTEPVSGVQARTAAAPKPDTREQYKAAHKLGFIAYVKHGLGAAQEAMRELLASLGPQEQHALLGTQGDLGGFLVPEDFRSEVIRDLAGFTVVRNLARVIPTGSSVLVFPSIQSATNNADIYGTGFVGSWKPEGYVTGGTAPTVQNQPKFGQERIPVHSWQPDAIELTQELLNDSAAPLDSILAEIIAETRGLDEDAAFLLGSGVGQPLGVLHASAGITTVKTGSATALTYDGLVDLTYSLPAQYRQRATYVMSSLGYAGILKLKDNQSYPIIPPNSTPDTLWGRPVRYSEFVADPGSATLPIIFGDWRYYGIADRQDLRVQRLNERFAPNIGLLPHARLGGQPLRKAAFRVQKCEV
jgi:HK97 family phage major capsid protein